MDLSYKVRGEDIRLDPLNKFEMKDGNIVAIYQGSRGQYPNLDFIVKYRKEGIRLRTPSHTHWIIDLVIKGEIEKELTLALVEDFIQIYDTITPFDKEEDRNSYQLVYPQRMIEKYQKLRALQTVGYKEFYTHPKASEKELISLIALKTRQYAKKQITWLKKEQTIIKIPPKDIAQLELSNIDMSK